MVGIAYNIEWFAVKSFNFSLNLFIIDNLDYLHHLLTQFESPDLNKSIKVPNWSNQGQIFLDFIDINEKVKTIIVFVINL